MGIPPKERKDAKIWGEKLLKNIDFRVILGLTNVDLTNILSFALKKKEFRAKTAVSDQSNINYVI